MTTPNSSPHEDAAEELDLYLSEARTTLNRFITRVLELGGMIDCEGNIVLPMGLRFSTDSPGVRVETYGTEGGYLHAERKRTLGGTEAYFGSSMRVNLIDNEGSPSDFTGVQLFVEGFPDSSDGPVHERAYILPEHELLIVPE